MSPAAGAERFATIDVGTNTVLLLVAERRDDSFAPLVERAEITRLGRGVDRAGRLDPAAIADTVAVLARYAAEARALGAAGALLGGDVVLGDLDPRVRREPDDDVA
ncbi:MAG TPA: hypothetical protein VFK85_03315, partial [Anaeromyxobacteraceae bacterium]|nr:hypothetical protein [Anaeromyxobacteraceae bacterium]